MAFTSTKIPDTDGFYSIMDNDTSKIVGEVRKVYTGRSTFRWTLNPVQFPITDTITTRRGYSQKRTAVDALKAYYKSEGVRVSLVY